MLTTYLITRRRTGRIRAAFIALGAYLRRKHANRRAVRDLYMLSDHQLRDIGISRGDIERSVDRGRDWH